MTDLVLQTVRPAKAGEVSSLIFGTGVLSYPWWGGVTQMREGAKVSVAFDDCRPEDTFVFVHDTELDEEGSFAGRTELTVPQILEAAGKAIVAGQVYEADAITENLGFCDADQADCVLQLAVFKTIVFG